MSHIQGCISKYHFNPFYHSDNLEYWSLLGYSGHISLFFTEISIEKEGFRQDEL